MMSEQEKQMLRTVCDIALKSPNGGLQLLPMVTHLIGTYGMPPQQELPRMPSPPLDGRGELDRSN